MICMYIYISVYQSLTLYIQGIDGIDGIEAHPTGRSLLSRSLCRHDGV